MTTRRIARFAPLAFVSILVACGGSSATNPTPSAPTGTTTTTTGGMASSAPSSIDGKSYDITLSIPGENPEKDTLNFAQGKFESAACTPLGFPKWTDYAASPEGDGTTFHVTTHHPSGTVMEWRGTTHGDTVEGTATRTMNGKTETGTFKGTLHK